jgi:hypothetical protein
LLADELPLPGANGSAGSTANDADARRVISNSDPITGQAGWYDVRVRIRPADPEPVEATWPQVEAVPAAPGVRGAERVVAYFAGRKAQ